MAKPSKMTLSPSSLEAGPWGGQHERKDLTRKLVETANTYALNPTVGH
jgi:hypothetical protein